MPFEYDQVNIVCPVYAPGTHESDAEKYIIYNVSVTYYNLCCAQMRIVISSYERDVDFPTQYVIIIIIIIVVN